MKPMPEDLRSVTFAMEQQLKRLEGLFTTRTRLTIVARHLDEPDATIVVTADPDVEALVTAIRGVNETVSTEAR